MRILAIPATNSVSGLNRGLLGYAEKALFELAASAVVSIVDLNDFEMPLYSPAREERDGAPPEAHRLLQLIRDADGLIVSFAEYNGSYTPVWKNTFDWMSRVDQAVFSGKPVVMFAATPGPRAGAGVLWAATTTAPFFGAELCGSLGVGTFEKNFDFSNGRLTNPAIDVEFRRLLQQLVTAVASQSKPTERLN